MTASLRYLSWAVTKANVKPGTNVKYEDCRPTYQKILPDSGPITPDQIAEFKRRRVEQVAADGGVVRKTRTRAEADALLGRS